ncbi:Cytochrome c oxidase assembly protein cox19 [Tulasnella sp. JGI-2019a]|nr:Cytochrome c oxidase assembly protein cox19 [Tulasnella sp. JGI-2019a]KAG9005303.1 Cytochrome c oxidase assembly protein cox19 [Tulasnella sp. JGI-2019a]KAG9034864.1 Cytochrome c oxidase assembly protein cox19 [Tulasnella sp. JGI-2019a]
MSFGRPPTFTDFKVSPPQRGSFPLDHDGECKEFMKTYLQCLKSYGQESVNCRNLSKEYLECRMSRALMDRTEWKNLGYKGVGEDQDAQQQVKQGVGEVKLKPTSQRG